MRTKRQLLALQKLMGAVLIILAVFSACLEPSDATGALVLFIIGIHILLTKRIWIY